MLQCRVQFGVLKARTLERKGCGIGYQLMLRQFTGVILRVVVVVLVLIGVEVAFPGTFSDSESVSSVAVMMVCFLDVGTIRDNISFWFSAKILVRSDMISFLSEDLISSRFSVRTLGDLLVPATGFKFWLVSGIAVSFSVETNSSTAFLYWLLVVIFREKERVVVLWKIRILRRNLVFRNEVLT